MESISSSTSAPLHKSRIGKFTVFHVRPSRTHNSTFTLLLFFFCCLNLIPRLSASFTISASDSEALYAQNCNHIVPQSSSPSSTSYANGLAIESLRFRTGYFTGGDPLFKKTELSVGFSDPKSVTFRPIFLRKTVADGIYEVRANLHLRDRSVYVSLNSTNRRLRMIHYRGPRFPTRKGILGFTLNGFWSESSGKLCMVGSGSVYFTGNAKSLSVVLKLNYPRNSSIYSSLITGTLESLNVKHNPYYFEPISLLALSQNLSYEYTLMKKENDNGCISGYGGKSLSLNESYPLCSILGNLVERFELEYGSDCDGVSCNPVGGSAGYVPDLMFYYKTRCTDASKMQMLLGFPNTNYSGGVKFPFVPSTTFIAEGAWDEKENQLCGIACRILTFTELTNASVGDCSVKFSLRFPASLSLRNRSTVVGQIWSNNVVNSSGYIRKIGFQNSGEMLMGMLDFKYEYDNSVDTPKKTCARKNPAGGKGKTYPNEHSLDMRFDMSVRNGKGQVAWGYSTPLYVGDELHQSWFYQRRYFGHQSVSSEIRKTDPSVKLNSRLSSIHNISYKMSFTPPPDFKFSHDSSLSKAVEISAEGTYDRDTGVLCMIGCRRLRSKIQNLVKNDTLDCEIIVNIQFSPLNGNGGKNVKGSIQSTRGKSDPLYFGRLELSSNSLYTRQAKASIWRMDLEITMVLISNTLACVFIGLQLFYVKKHPNVLPFISIVMLVILTMGHMIPLLLNFEALFVANHSQQTLFIGSGGWLEVNEVIVRVVTMVAFLLQLRLLQQTWSARQEDGSQKCFWASEVKVLYVTLPLYMVGALIAWFVPHQHNLYRAILHPHRKTYVVHPLQRFSLQQHSRWEDLKSYAGLVLDGFLLPQILFNLFLHSGEKALIPFFYIGTTMVRLLPHAYDLFRAHSSAWYLDLSYIYANHRMDFYSTAWNIIIPCGGLLFAVVIFLQQRFSGRCIVPRRFRESSVYEKVPVISNDDL
ncbi:hypothetical protein FEM48_Zijuj01G0155000 [Ziziphus jujuba var. spinosa]|uniref:RING-type E3 ubiquitin transferase n=1 Tax=Ziziphus jujuba var. spinosa TaxID=714518 RepID=A0A978W221_ZIZJJ|nr:hypothetical protein FEM48_Zijuj01G0155000 [Ziziphus jujuba var. spinosa]